MCEQMQEARMNILWNMLDNNNWSDLQIETATHTFDVHKSVVCPACPFFEAACTGDWKEARAGIIELPELEIVIRGLLEWCYGVFHDTDFQEDSRFEGAKSYYELMVAADKYQLPDLKIEAEYDLDFSDIEGVEQSAELALWLYKEERRQVVGPKLTRRAIRQLAYYMTDVLNGEYWEKIQACPELLKDLVRFTAQASSRVCDTEKLVDPEYLRNTGGKDD